MNQKLVTALKNAGIKLTDTNGNDRPFKDVISEIASKWDKLEEMVYLMILLKICLYRN